MAQHTNTSPATVDQNTQMPVQQVGTADMLFAPGMLDQLDRFANMMASGKATVPAHLKGSPADCLAVTMQAAQWRMNPFAVAQKTHIVSGNLGYEAQLVNAVINSMAPTKDRIHYEWFGPWENVIGKFKEKPSKNGGTYLAPGWTLHDEQGCGVRVWATLKGEDQPRELELLLSQAQVRNSTLWASDPKQQLAYLAVKRWSRLYCPDVIMGVYTPDELQELPPQMEEKDITPSADELNGAIMPRDQKPSVSADEMIEAINGATTPQEMTDAVVDVDELDDNDKARVRKAYTDKVKAIKQEQLAQQQANTSEGGPVFGYPEVAEQINKAKTLDDLDTAESLISSVKNPVHQSELKALADARRQQLDFI